MSDAKINYETSSLTSSTAVTVRDKESVEGYISIPEFYNGRSIFITGGTGWLLSVII